MPKYLVPIVAVVCIGALIWLAFAPGSSLDRCKNNLTELGKALDDFHVEHGSFPAAYTPDAPPTSWRVELLPHLGQQQLYETYDQQQPWDAPANRALLGRRPDEYGCPEVEDPTETSYVAVLGAQSAWPFDEAIRLKDFENGTSNCALILDLHSHETEWTRPQDSEFDKAVAALGNGQRHKKQSADNLTNVLMADGSVRTLSGRVPEDVARYFLSPKSGRPTSTNPERVGQLLGPASKFGKPVSADSIAKTTMWPSPDVELVEGNSLIYCPTLAIAFQRSMQLRPEPQLTSLGRKLVETSFSTGDVSPEAISVDVRSTNDELTCRCRLRKQLTFAAVFDSFKVPLQFEWNQLSQPVRSFGVTSHWDDWKAALAQVRVHDFQSPDNFVISIANLAGDDLILAKLPRPETLDAGIDEIVDRIRSSNLSKQQRGVVKGEDLVIPVLELSVFDDFREELTHPSFDWELREAMQEIRLRLDERGAVVYSDSFVNRGQNGAHSYAAGTRDFIFDKPFLIMLRENQDTQPYFAAWVGNTDLMIPTRSTHL